MDNFVAVTLLRHGMTVANHRRAYLGWSDSPLCKEEDVRLLALSGSLQKPDLIFSSNLGRCIETANMLYPNEEVSTFDFFREMNFGDWEGKTHQELEQDPIYKKWLERPFDERPPKGECFADFAERVDNGWEVLKACVQEAEAKEVVLVSHGGVIRCLMERLSPMERHFWDWVVPHAGGYRVCWTEEAFRRGERCTLFSEVPITGNRNG